MAWNEIASAICICCSATIFSLSLQFNTKIKIFFVQIFASVLYILNYVFVIKTALAGVIAASFEMLRLITFYIIENKEKFNTKKINLIAGISFAVVLTICGIVTWDAWYSVLPLIGAIVCSVVMGTKNVFLLKCVYIFQTLCIVIYLIMLGLWINMATQVVVLICGIIGLISFVRKMKKEN